MTARIRILHVVGGMNYGGVETWLMHVLRHIDRTHYQMDFLVHTTDPCAYDNEIRALGSRIIPCLHPSHPLKYAQNLSHILKEYGPYDVVHSHVHHYSGWVLRTAAQAGVPIRIAHSHSDTLANQLSSSFLRKLYFTFMNFLIQKNATHKIGVSKRAAIALFGHDWNTKKDHQVIYYGFDFAPFAQIVNKPLIRKEVGIPEDAFVVGHVGSFGHPKNHMFLLDIFSSIHKVDPTAYYLLVGDGRLRPEIEQKIQTIGLEGRVILAGLRNDVATIMLSAMDCFLFPSLYEGLGIVLIEAQAAGLPCVYSDVVPEEAAIVPELMHPLSLNQSAHKWAQIVLACKEDQSAISQAEALSYVQHSIFSIKESVNSLVAIYNG